jgi:hypothetical protein
MLKRSLMQVFTKVNRPPAPMPWTARPAINMSMSMLTAHIRLPMKKTKLAMSSTGFRPKMSLTLPHTGVAAAAARRYAEPIQV